MSGVRDDAIGHLYGGDAGIVLVEDGNKERMVGSATMYDACDGAYGGAA